MKYLKYIFLTLTLLASTHSIWGASSFFAKNFVRSLFDIKTSEEKVILKKTDHVLTHSDFKILVWNIYKGELFQKSPLPVNMEDYALVLLQEYDDSISPSFLPKTNLYFLPTFEWEKSLTGVAIYSDLLLRRVTPLHTKYREPFILTPKSSLIAYYKDILIINTHALNFVSEDEWLFELKEISKFIKEDKKVIWAGDFNAWNSERTQLLLTHMDQLGLEQVPFKEDERTHHLGFPIDFIFMKGLSFKNQRVIEAEEYSDHNPLILTITPMK